jgi:integrase
MQPNAVTLESYAVRWLTQPAALHPRTVAVYRHSLRALFAAAPALAATRLTTLRRRDIRTAVRALLATGLKPNTVRNAHIALSACLASAVEDELLAENPAHGAARRLFARPDEPGLMRSMTRAQLTRFLDAAEIVAPQFRVIFLVLAFAGLRIGECLALQPDDIDLEGNRLRVARQWVAGKIDAPKFRRARTVDISADLAALLARRHAALPGHRFLFQTPYRRKPQPVDPKTVQDAMRRVCRAAKLPAFTPHCLRHTAAVMLLEETGDLLYVQRVLGHRSISITADVYGQGARPTHRDTLDRLALLHRPPHRAAPVSVGLRRPA